jgi:DNA mismatch endonuclease, patch repair protein
MVNYQRDGRAPIPESEKTSRVMSANRGKNTSPELKLRKALREAGLLGYRLHWKNVPGRPDIVYPRFMLAIFVHGDFWHRCPVCDLPLPKTHTDFWESKLERNVKRDREIMFQLKTEGWTAFVFWEHEVKADVGQCVEKVRAHIKGLRTVRT